MVRAARNATGWQDSPGWTRVLRARAPGLRCVVLLATALLAGGCAQRPVNAPLAEAARATHARYGAELLEMQDKRTVVALAFSGGGTRAAAFSYGVLEALRDIEFADARGRPTRLLDQVAVVTGVSGGSFTALAWGLYGDRLFEEYEARFLKRNVEGALLERLADPVNWARLASPDWGRSELAAEYYDEILFGGATFGDLARRRAPLIVPTATDIATGTRVPFQRGFFDLICSDLASFPLSRAAAASSAVPVVLSPVTLDNRAGSCTGERPPWLGLLESQPSTSSATRALRHLLQLARFADASERPFLHLVDGGLSDNLGIRGTIEVLETVEALHAAGASTVFDDVRRILVIVVNSQSERRRDWSRHARPPGTLDVLLQASAVPISDFTVDAVDILRDLESRWALLQALRRSPAFAPERDPAIAARLRVPDIQLNAIYVSFDEIGDTNERTYLNDLPTSFALSPEQVDRLRRAARRLVHEAPALWRALADRQARVVTPAVAP